jgi:hypothetical protein
MWALIISVLVKNLYQPVLINIDLEDGIRT